MPECFVTLDKYKNDITAERVMNFYARKKFERIYVMLRHQISFIDSLESSTQGLHWLHTIRAGLQDILDIEKPLVAASPRSPSPDKEDFLSVSSEKFSSVADGVQTSWFDDIGENPYPIQGK